MHPSEVFAHCPRCGTAREPERSQPIRCSACQFTYYCNTTCATAAFLIRPDGKALFIRRAKAPAEGKLAIPGGFIDEGETAEDGLRREFMEEVGLVPLDIRFLCSFPNTYHYKDITYPVLDFFFTARAQGDEEPQCLDGVAGVCWLHPAEVNPEDIAFPSMTLAIQHYLSQHPA
jgi:ADP-ribose pyrophosphatase YjhB (NUDIX family)